MIVEFHHSHPILHHPWVRSHLNLANEVNVCIKSPLKGFFFKVLNYGCWEDDFMWLDCLFIGQAKE